MGRFLELTYCNSREESDFEASRAYYVCHIINHVCEKLPFLSFKVTPGVFLECQDFSGKADMFCRGLR